MEDTRDTIAVMGFGNPCRSDDAIGIYILDQVRQRLPREAPVTFFDMGTSAFEVLFHLKGHTRIILADAVLHSGEPDGTLFRLPASEITSAIREDPMVFLHSLKWDQALSYAQKMLREAYPRDISVYLVAISDTRLDIQLSEPVRQAGDRVAQLISESITEAVA
jgi:hydrogenase maturation protease